MSSKSITTGLSGGSSILSRTAWYSFSLCVFPLLLTLFNSRWLFVDLEKIQIDPWIYLGFSLDLKAHLKAFYGTYYATRLPWILPGYLAHKLFSPFVANFVLHMTFYYVSLFSLFRTLKRTVGLRAAFLTALLMGFYIPALREFGSNYITGAALAYLFLTTSFLTYPNRSKYSPLYLFFAGVFCSCFLFTQLFLVVFIPLVALFYLLLNRPHTLKFLLMNMVFFTIGFVTTTSIFCWINNAITGHFLFFEPIYKWTKDFVKIDNMWWLPLSSWDWSLQFIIGIAGALFFGSILTLIFRREKIISIFSFYYIINFFLFVFGDILFKQPVMQLHYYFCYIFPALFLAIGGILSSFLNQISGKKYYGLVAFAIIVGFYGCLTNDLQKDQLIRVNIIVIFSIGVLSITFFFLKKRVFSYAGTILLIGAFFMTNSCFTPAANVQSKTLKNTFSSVVKGIRATYSLDPSLSSLFWYRSNDCYRCISSAYLWQYRLVNEDFPNLGNIIGGDTSRLNNKKIYLLTGPEEAPLEEANKSLVSVGLKGEMLKEIIVREDDIKIKISHIHVTEID